MSLFDSLQTAIRGNKTTLHLGAFGKHPGWDDHLEDFGLETETLLAVKQLLYVQGIGGVIDSGAWEKLAPGELFPDFKHTFVWKTGRELIAGRMWSSTDRKGRARYPMIVCVHTSSNFPAANLLPWLFPALARMERSCQATRESTEVVAILTRERETLRRQLEEIGDIAPPSAKPVPPQCSEEEWLRIVYSAESHLEPFGPDKISKAATGLTRRSANTSVECQHLRLPIPAIPASDAGIFSFWFDFLAPWIAPEAACLLFQVDGESWADFIAGPPTSKELFCLKARPEVLPKTSDIPFTLSKEFRASARSRILGLAVPDKSMPIQEVPVSAPPPIPTEATEKPTQDAPLAPAEAVLEDKLPSPSFPSFPPTPVATRAESHPPIPAETVETPIPEAPLASAEPVPEAEIPAPSFPSFPPAPVGDPSESRPPIPVETVETPIPEAPLASAEPVPETEILAPSFPPFPPAPVEDLTESHPLVPVETVETSIPEAPLASTEPVPEAEIPAPSFPSFPPAPVEDPIESHPPIPAEIAETPITEAPLASAEPVPEAEIPAPSFPSFPPAPVENSTESRPAIPAETVETPIPDKSLPVVKPISQTRPPKAPVLPDPVKPPTKSRPPIPAKAEKKPIPDKPLSLVKPVPQAKPLPAATTDPKKPFPIVPIVIAVVILGGVGLLLSLSGGRKASTESRQNNQASSDAASVAVSSPSAAAPAAVTPTPALNPPTAQTTPPTSEASPATVAANPTTVAAPTVGPKPTEDPARKEREAKLAELQTQFARGLPPDKSVQLPPPAPDESLSTDAKKALDRLARWQAIQKEEEPSRLNKGLNDPDPWIQLQTWTRLDTFTAKWPSTAGQLKQDQEAEKPLTDYIKKIPGNTGNQTALLLAPIHASKKDHFLRALKNASTPGEIEEILKLLPKELNELELAKACSDPVSQFNLALHALNHPSNLSKEWEQCLPIFEKVASASPLLTGAINTLKGSAKPNQDWKPRFQPDSGHWTWKEQPSETATLENSGTPELTFKLVREGPADAFYLCTTELSIGVFKAWLESHRDSATKLKGIWENQKISKIKPGEDTRTAAIGWVFTGNASAIDITCSGAWAAYATDFPEKPRTDHPLNWIPAEVAQAVARDFGCRLPRVGEWEVVAKRLESEGQHSSANLRDDSWGRFWSRLGTGPQQTMLLRRFTAEIFRPVGAKPSDVPVTSENDETAWFRPVTTGDGEFPNFFGNVAVFLNDNQDEKKFLVAGGSALSGPEVDIHKPLPLGMSQVNSAYADVGIRLALDAERVKDANLSDLKKAIADTKYLIVPKP